MGYLELGAWQDQLHMIDLSTSLEAPLKLKLTHTKI